MTSPLMRPLTSSDSLKEVVGQRPNPGELNFREYEFAIKIFEGIGSQVQNISTRTDLALPAVMQQEFIIIPLEEMAKRAAVLFETPGVDKGILDSPDFLEFLRTGFKNIIVSAVTEAAKLPPNSIAECGICEAVFTHAVDKKPIVATDSLGPCVGVAGYDSQHKYGFVIHFANTADLEASGDMLIEKIKEIAKNPITAPIGIHLRGGYDVPGPLGSKPLVRAIEEWVQSGYKKGCPMGLLSVDVLQKKVENELGQTNTMSISLDTRNGQVSTYDRSTNPYAKQKKQINSEEELNKMISEISVEVLSKNPGITIVYPES